MPLFWCSWFKSNLITVEKVLLYLPPQIHLLIGGERVTCHWSKLTNSLGRKKLTNSLTKQQFELSTRTWSSRALWNRVCQSPWCQKATEVGQRFSLEQAFIIQEKGFITAKTYQINKGENLNILSIQAFNLTPKMGRPRLATRSCRSSIAVARKENSCVIYNKICCSSSTQRWNSRVKHQKKAKQL